MKAVLVFLLAAVLLGSVAHAHETGEHVTSMPDNGFEPAALEIEVGETVTFKNTGKEMRWPASNIHPTHEIYLEFDPKDIVKPGESWSFTFRKPGIWQFHDHVHPQFTGVITVTGEEKAEETAAKAFVRALFAMLAILSGNSPALTGMVALLQTPPEKENTLPYDETIAENDELVFTNETALYSYTKKYGPFKTVKRLHALSAKLGNCHQQAHNAGRLAYELNGAKAFQLCSGECHSGCYHGATEAYFQEHGTQNLKDDLKVICNDELNPFFLHQCVHGIGHGLTAWSNYEIHDALRNCDLVETNLGSCYTGVFMENIVGGLAEDHKTKYLSDDPQYPCTIVEDKYKWSCYFYQSARMRQLYNDDFKKVTESCLAAPEMYRQPCIESMGRDISGAHSQQPEPSIADCQYAPKGALRKLCLAGAVQDEFWDPSGQDTALKFCRLLTDGDEKEACIKVIASRAKDLLTVEERGAFCAKAEPLYQETCIILSR